MTEQLNTNGDLLLIGPLSKKMVSGMRLAFDMLIDGLAEREITYSTVDISPEKEGSVVGEFRIARALSGLTVIFAVWKKILHVDRVYITISQTYHGFFRDALIVWPSAFLSRKIYVHCHSGGYGDFYSSSSKFVQWLIKQTLSRVDVIIVLGELLSEQFSFVPDYQKKIYVVRNGLPKESRYTKATVKHIVKDEPIRLLYLSNMIISKGYLDVLKSCQILVHELKVPICCDFCGNFISIKTTQEDYYYTAELAKTNFFELIEKYGLTQHVNYHGLVMGQKKIELLNTAHLFVLPTYYPWEGQPISIIEALAHGTPIISTRHRGIPEQVIDGFNGYFVDHHAPDQIAESVKRFWDDPYNYPTFSKNALEHYQKYFTQEEYQNRLISVLTR